MQLIVCVFPPARVVEYSMISGEGYLGDLSSDMKDSKMPISQKRKCPIVKLERKMVWESLRRWVVEVDVVVESETKAMENRIYDTAEEMRRLDELDELKAVNRR